LGIKNVKEVDMIESVLFGVFISLHALVHLLYAGHTLRFFELRPGLTWPDGSWLLSRFGNPAVRWLAAVSLTLAALGFLVAGLGLSSGRSGRDL
jgi:hypothetical protein